ncbi:unnamed protein product [Adineta steineri]|uniref:G-protein coupled receptors family 1 profile domain-containing protein n=1 Tax=Adineta steineri TaxID=433720 RepID=A0A813V7Q7_9BILA|nr:unnamed protein product [Adineta steineri]CAF1069930.1 unnamed protein product [Adineta steineri]
MTDNTSFLSSSNSSDDESGVNDGPTLNTRIILVSTWIIIAVAGIIGNSLVIYVATRFQKMNNVTNCFIVNLAITDIVFLAFCMPLLVVQYTSDKWLFNEIFCKLLNFISYVSVLVTVLTLVAMTIDRYIYVVRPFQNLKWRKPSTVFLLSIIIWLISCIFASPFYYHYGVDHTDDDDYRQCILLSDDDLQKYFRIYIVTLYYFIPLTIIVITYTRLLYYVYAKENRLKPKTKHHIVKWSKKRRAVTRMVAIVTVVFSLCWLPLTLYIISANIFTTKTPFLYYFKVIAHSFAYLNSAINPLLYAFLNRSFRNNCGSLFSEKSCSLFFNEDYRPSQGEQHSKFRKHLPSTQTERFSYQSTNHHTTSIKLNKKKKTVSIISPTHQLKPDIVSHNDFSDADYYEISEVECATHIPLEKTTYLPHLPSEQYESLLTEKSNGSSTQTTSL